MTSRLQGVSPSAAPACYLPQCVLYEVLGYLGVQELCAARQVCGLWRDTAADERLWRQKAVEKWGEATVFLGEYSTYEELVRDDNKRQATIVGCLEGKASSSYRSNSPAYYCDAKLLKLQWCRKDDEIRLYFDARGELDLRRPERSSLALVATRDGPLALDDVVFARSPAKCELYVDKPGHYKGCMVWRGIGDVTARLLASPPRGAFCPGGVQQGLHESGVSLVFCYAAPVPVTGAFNTNEFSPAPVLALRPGQSLQGALEAGGGAQYELAGAPAEQYLSEGEAASRKRFADVPQAVLSRATGGSWWQ